MDDIFKTVSHSHTFLQRKYTYTHVKVIFTPDYASPAPYNIIFPNPNDIRNYTHIWPNGFKIFSLVLSSIVFLSICPFLLVSVWNNFAPAYTQISQGPKLCLGGLQCRLCFVPRHTWFVGNNLLSFFVTSQRLFGSPLLTARHFEGVIGS